MKRLSIKGLLIIRNSLHLGSRTTLWIKSIVQPIQSQLLGQLNTNNPLPKTQDLGIVTQDSALNGKGVVGSHGANAGHFVGGNGDAESRATDEEPTVSFALCNEFGALDSGVRVGGFVGQGGCADVDNGFDKGTLFEEVFDGGFVVVAGFVAGHDDAEGFEVGAHFVYIRIIGSMDLYIYRFEVFRV